jgi:hypothetical protein
VYSDLSEKGRPVSLAARAAAVVVGDTKTGSVGTGTFSSTCGSATLAVLPLSGAASGSLPPREL